MLSVKLEPPPVYNPVCDLSGYPIGSRETLTGTAALPYITGSSAAFNTKVTAAAEH